MIVLAVELGMRPDRVPLRIGCFGKVPAYRAEVHELDAGASEPSYPVAHVVLADAAAGDLGILAGDAAEGDEQLAVTLQIRPGALRARQVLHGRQYVRQQGSSRPEAVGANVTHIAAKHVEEAVHMRLGMMEATGACPSIRAAEDGIVAIIGDRAADFARQDVQRFVPRHFYKSVKAALFPRGSATFEETPANRRTSDARGRIERTRNGLSDRRRVTVAFERFECRDAPVLDPHTVGAPMRRRQLRRRVRLVQNRVSGFHAGYTPLLPVLFGSRMIFY